MAAEAMAGEGEEAATTVGEGGGRGGVVVRSMDKEFYNKRRSHDTIQHSRDRRGAGDGFLMASSWTKNFTTHLKAESHRWPQH